MSTNYHLAGRGVELRPLLSKIKTTSSIPRDAPAWKINRDHCQQQCCWHHPHSLVSFQPTLLISSASLDISYTVHTPIPLTSGLNTFHEASTCGGLSISSWALEQWNMHWKVNFHLDSSKMLKRKKVDLVGLCVAHTGDSSRGHGVLHLFPFQGIVQGGQSLHLFSWIYSMTLIISKAFLNPDNVVSP